MRWIYFLFLAGFCLFYSIVNAQNDTIFKYEGGKYVFKKKSKYELVKVNGADTTVMDWNRMFQWIEYDLVKYYIVIKHENGINKTGLFNSKTGEIEIQLEYDDLRPGHKSSFIILRKGGLKGLYSLKYKKTTPVLYSDISYHFYNNSYALADSTCYVYNEKMTLIDSIKGVHSIKGKLGDQKYLKVGYLKGEALLNENNNLIKTNDWSRIIDLAGSCLMVDTDKGVGIYNIRTLKLVEPYVYDTCMYNQYSEGYLILLKRKNDWKLIDTTGRQFFNTKAQELKPDYAWEVFLFKENGLWGAKNLNGTILQSPKWKAVKAENNGERSYLSATMPNGQIKQYLYITKKLNDGRIIINELKEYGGKKENVIIEEFKKSKNP
jgi:hypothetical protein